MLPDCADRQAYARLVEARRAELESKLGANDEWNWYGNTSLLVYGTVRR